MQFRREKLDVWIPFPITPGNGMQWLSVDSDEQLLSELSYMIQHKNVDMLWLSDHWLHVMQHQRLQCAMHAHDSHRVAAAHRGAT